MIKLIVGLGNPGRQYEKTRHNAGFLFLDKLVSQWSGESRFSALIAECRVAGERVILLKPQTFMNKSGESVGKVARYFKLLPEEILVVHDELDIDEGALKLKSGGGHAGHNGLRSIVSHLGSKEFLRLRIGIGRPKNEGTVAHYVLSEPSLGGFKQIEEAFSRAESVLGKIVMGEVQAAMNDLH